MRKIWFVFPLILILSLMLGACSPATQSVSTPAVTASGGTSATSTPLAAATTEPSVTESPLGTSTMAATEAPLGTSTPAVGKTTTAQATGTSSTGGSTTATSSAVGTAMPGTSMTANPTAAPMGTGTPGASTTTSPSVTGTAVLPSTGSVDLFRASNWMNQTVKDSTGQTVGQVQDLAINLANTQVEWIILNVSTKSTGKPEYIPVPWRAFQLTQGAAPSLSVSNDKVQAATPLDLKAVPVLIPQDWEDEFGAYWAGVITPTASTTPTAEATGTPQPGALTGVVLASNFVGKQLNGPTNAALGKIDDVIIDTSNGQVLYLVLTPNQGLGLSQKSILIPVQVLKWDAAKQAASLSVAANQLSKAPGIDLSSLPDFNSPELKSALTAFWAQFMTRK